MSFNFQITVTTDTLSSLSNDPYKLGHAVGELLSVIPTLVHKHLNYGVHDSELHKNMKTASKSIDTTDLIWTVKAALTQLRTGDGVTAAFPDDLKVDRKQRKPRRMYAALYTSQIEKAFQARITQLLKHTVDWEGRDHREFNKGFDHGLTGMVWDRYPSHNVALKAGEEEWGIWLRKACEQLEKEVHQTVGFDR